MIMKKGLLTILTVIGFIAATTAQSLQVESYDAVTNVNSVHGGVDYEAHVTIKNIGTSAVNVLCTRYEYGANWCAFDSNYFCWDLCYGNATSQSIGGWLIQPEDINNQFSGHVYSPYSSATCVDSVRYVFYVENNRNDSVSVVLKFSAAPNVGVEEDNLKSVTAYPNPARYFFFVEFKNQPEANTTIEVYNLLGSKVKSVSAKSKKVEINVSGLKSGIYLYTISKDGNAVETRKIMVNN